MVYWVGGFSFSFGEVQSLSFIWQKEIDIWKQYHNMYDIMSWMQKFQEIYTCTTGAYILLRRRGKVCAAKQRGSLSSVIGTDRFLYITQEYLELHNQILHWVSCFPRPQFVLWFSYSSILFRLFGSCCEEQKCRRRKKIIERSSVYVYDTA